MQNKQKKGGGARKIGRDKAKCEHYRRKRIRERNKEKRIRKANGKPGLNAWKDGRGGQMPRTKRQPAITGCSNRHGRYVPLSWDASAYAHRTTKQVRIKHMLRLASNRHDGFSRNVTDPRPSKGLVNNNIRIVSR